MRTCATWEKFIDLQTDGMQAKASDRATKPECYPPPDGASALMFISSRLGYPRFNHSHPEHRHSAFGRQVEQAQHINCRRFDKVELWVVANRSERPANFNRP